MKMLKRAAALVLCLMLAFSLTACVPGSDVNIFNWPLKLVQSLSDAREAISDKISDAVKEAEAEIERPEEKASPEEEERPVKPVRPEKTGPAGTKEDAVEESGKESAEKQQEKPEEEPAEVSGGQDTASGSFMPEYYHYDKADFEALIDKMNEAAEAGDEDALEKAYEAAYDELLLLNDLYSSSYLKYSDNVSDQESDEEMNYSKSLSIECEDLLCTTMLNILESPGSEALKKYLGAELTDYFLDYEPMTEETKAIYDEITDLETDYYAEVNHIDKYSYEYNGREWTLDDLNDMETAESFAREDPRGYLETFNGILKKFNDKVGPMYIRLVELRNQMAKIYGYDNYAEYAYKEIYDREYSMEDAAAFCEIIKANVAPKYYTYVYYGGAFTTDIDYTSSVEGLIEDLGEIAGEISPLAEKAYERLKSEKLYDIGYEEDRIDSSYTNYLESKKVPYIFAHLGGESSDLVTMTHEFGHFAYFSQAADMNYFLRDFYLDLMEMHSNGFEALSTQYYDRFFGVQADDALHYTLGNILSNIVDGCIQDEFQRRVYAEEDLDLDKVNAIFTEVATSYGQYSLGDTNYEWCLVPHNYESPLYYLSYAVSALTALEIWDIAQEDYEKGVEAWENLVQYADEGENYFKTLEKCGLSPFTDSGRVNEICGQVLEKFGAGEYDIYQWIDDIFN